MTLKNTILPGVLTCLFLVAGAHGIRADDDDPLNRRIVFSKRKDTVYRLLKDVTARTGLMFVYDSQVIDNDRKTTVPKGEYTLRDAIRVITRKQDLRIDIVGNHVLLRLPEKTVDTPTAAVDTARRRNSGYYEISGTLHDLETKEPIAYATVSLVNSSVGTVSNQRGEFRLLAPDSLRQPAVRFSHIGYESLETAADLIAGRRMDFALEPKVFMLNEIEVRRVNPLAEIGAMLDRRDDNYPVEPTLLTVFYREGINYGKRPVDVSEAVLEVYKSGYRNDASADHARLVRKRHVSNIAKGDTILPKMKSGVRSCLILDIMKELPDFIRIDEGQPYRYAHDNITAIDDRIVNVVAFRQVASNDEPLFTGELYIDSERKALEEVRFEVNPDYVEKATNFYIDRKAHNLKLSLKQASYIVSYKPSESSSPYFINHIRGDIVFRVRKKGQLFSSPLHFWFEMVTCKIDTTDVSAIPRSERLSAGQIFSETQHPYDHDFWDRFNIILPEEKLRETLINSVSEVVVNAN